MAHHAASFAAVRWTNLYFPCAGVIHGDVIGGPLAGLFGWGVKDIGVTTGLRGGYLDFLQAIPNDWISKRKVAPHSPGWAPFAGQLSQASRRLSVKVVFSMFQWLVDARYLPFNPWTLVNRKLGDQARPLTASSRAFTPQAWSALLA